MISFMFFSTLKSLRTQRKLLGQRREKSRARAGMTTAMLNHCCRKYLFDLMFQQDM